jgi:hypothetical protein
LGLLRFRPLWTFYVLDKAILIKLFNNAKLIKLYNAKLIKLYKA